MKMKIDRQVLLEGNQESIDVFKKDGADFSGRREVEFRVRLPDKESAAAVRDKLRELHDFSLGELVMISPHSSRDGSYDQIIAIRIPVNAETITYFEYMQRSCAIPFGSYDPAWEIQPD